MWVLFGAIAILSAVSHVICMVKKKDAALFRFISLSATALTVCALYGLDAKWVAEKDWSAMMDVVPAMSKVAWVCVIASIVINGVSLMKKKK